MILAKVGAEIILHRLSSGLTERLSQELSYPNPEHTAAIRLNLSLPDDIPRYLSALKVISPESAVAPRGAAYSVRRVISEAGEEVTFCDHRSWGSQITTKEIGALRDYQEDGAQAIKRHTQGTIVLPCGAGKTVLGIRAISLIRRTTLIIVPTKDLIKQWAESIQSMLSIKTGIFGAGKHTVGPITIATIGALRWHLKKESCPDLTSFGMVILDECHLVPPAAIRQVIGSIPARWRLGLTATPERDDDLESLIEWTMGPILLRRSAFDLAKDGWLVLPTVQPITTNFRYHMSDKEDRRVIEYTWLKNAIAHNRGRNNQIADIATSLDDTTLILSNHKEHCQILADLIAAREARSVGVITSDVAKKKREDLIQGLRDGKLDIGIATSLADTGLDIQRLAYIILALPGGSTIGSIQRPGRLMRPHGSKKPIVFDLVDVNVSNLNNRWRKREGVYRDIGMRILPFK